MIATPPLTLNGLLAQSGIASKDVLVFRHRPWEAELNRVFDWLVSEHRDLFDCYQDSHAPRTEAALMRARYVASFIRHASGTALFVGLYEIRSSMVMTKDEYRARPLHQELMKLGMSGDFNVKDGCADVRVFDMPVTDWHAEWCGRLIVRWPGLERSWYRWADRNIFEVEAITRDPIFTPALQRWDELVISWNQLAKMPKGWAASMSQWRGIYLITDESDNMHYVGSASGAENILQRWRDYARTGHGGNKLLKGRDPATFRFSVLQLVAQDLSQSEVVQLEQRWKQRLRTIHPFGLNDN